MQPASPQPSAKASSASRRSARLILASASPRRRELLHDAGYDFLLHPASIDEQDYPADMLPPDVARHLAILKAQQVSRQFTGDVVLAADTVVAFGDEVIGKPDDADDARDILELLAGTTHLVITGVCLIHADADLELSTRVMSAVWMKDLTPAEIDRYIATGQWQGKAGAYGIQDRDPFVKRTAGSRSNIVGLPMSATKHLLAQAGIHPARKRPTQQP